MTVGPSNGKVLYFITSSLSSRLLRGQLDYVASQGFEVVVGVGVEVGSDVGHLTLDFDEAARVVDIGFAREIALINDLKSLFRAIQLVRKERPSIVNFSTPKAALIGAFSAWICRVPQRVYVVRGLRYETSTGVGRRLLIALEKLICRSATHIIMNGASLIDVAVADGLVSRDRCQVLAGGSGNGIDISVLVAVDESKRAARTRLGIPPDALVVGFVGRLTKDKGIVDLAQILPDLVERHPAVVLLAVGGFEDGDPVPSSTRQQLESSDHVIMAGWVENPAQAYAAMDLLAFPSYREGLPNVVLEAQLAGLPVVGYRATGTVDAVDEGKTGLLVPVSDTTALTDAASTVLNDSAMLEKMGSEARAFVEERFSREVVWADLVSVYNER